jgi:hypothetical protein
MRPAESSRSNGRGLASEIARVEAQFTLRRRRIGESAHRLGRGVARHLLLPAFLLGAGLLAIQYLRRLRRPARVPTDALPPPPSGARPHSRLRWLWSALPGLFALARMLLAVHVPPVPPAPLDPQR